MNKTFAKVIICLWVLLVILNVVLPKTDFSESENRYLATFPTFSQKSLVNGTFMQKVDEYINDHFIGRDTWITAKSKMEYLLGKRENNGVFICHDQLIEDLAEPTEKIVTANIAGLKHYADLFGKPTYILVAPSAASIQADRLPSFATGWDQKQFLTDLSEELKGQVTAVNVYDTLCAHKDEYIYYRTDHHWTTDGAFLAYQQLCAAMGITPSAYADFQVETISTDFNGTLYSKSGVRNVTPDTIKSYKIGGVNRYTITSGSEVTEYDTIYFPEFLEKKDKYPYFLNGNQPIVTIDTQSTSGKKLLMFKDSYAHCLTPMLLQAYSEITLVDLRYVNTNIQNLINIQEYDETLFLYSMDVFTHQSNTSKLSRMQ